MIQQAVKNNFNTVKRSVKHNSASRGLFIFVVIPTLLAIFYYYFVAANIYVSESKFSVNVEGHSAVASPLAMLMPNLSNVGSLHEATVVKEYINSSAMVDKLRKNAGLTQIYDNPNADFISRIPKDMNMENYQHQFNDRVEVVLDEVSGITTLRVRAYTPADAKKLGDAVVNEAEDFVNKMEVRVQEDAVKFASNEVDKSEKMILDIDSKLADLRSKNRNFDPAATTTNIVHITGKLEDELAETNAEIANLKNYMQQNSPKILSLEAKARSLQQQIGMQSGRLTEDSAENSSKLAKATDDYTALSLQKQFAMKRMEITLSSYESAQAEARKKSRYLLRIVEPTLPETATEPRRLREVLTVFFSCLVAYTLGGLIFAAIKDHIRP